MKLTIEEFQKRVLPGLYEKGDTPETRALIAETFPSGRIDHEVGHRVDVRVERVQPDRFRTDGANDVACVDPVDAELVEKPGEVLVIILEGPLWPTSQDQDDSRIPQKRLAAR